MHLGKHGTNEGNQAEEGGLNASRDSSVGVGRAGSPRRSGVKVGAVSIGSRSVSTILMSDHIKQTL